MTTRRFVLAGAAGFALSLAGLGRLLAADAVTRGVRRVSGDARINDKPAISGRTVKPGDTVVTGPNGDIVFVVGRDAFLLRAESRIELEGKSGSTLLTGLRIVTGRLLSVFASGEPKKMQTDTATIGIRGTGVYVEAAREKTYVCTCYGTVDIVSRDDPAQRETVQTRHHDQPRYVMAKGAPQMLMGAPVINHSDAELILLESLVGRKPPFGSTPYRY